MEEKQFSSQWNVSQGLVFELNRLRASANALFCAGKLSYAINYLISMKQTASSVFSIEEMKKLEAVEVEINENRYNKELNKPSGFNNSKKEHLDCLRNERLLYNKFNNLLNEYLQKHDLLLLEKADSLGILK